MIRLIIILAVMSATFLGAWYFIFHIIWKSMTIGIARKVGIAQCLIGVAFACSCVTMCALLIL